MLLIQEDLILEYIALYNFHASINIAFCYES